MQTQTLNILANEQGAMLPNSCYPMTGLDVVFKVRGEEELRHGQTSFIGSVDRDLKSILVFLGSDFIETQKFYPIEQVTHWKERVLIQHF